MTVDKTLTAVDNAVAGLCPCGAQPRPGSAYCSEDCRPSHVGPDTDAWRDGGPTGMRWRPDLVTAFDDSGLVLDWERAFSAAGLVCRTYRSDDGRLFARLDDGHRWVGMWLADSDTDTVRGADQMWDRLERELSDCRRLDPTPEYGPPVPLAALGVSAEELAAGLEQVGRLVWMPNPPADPDNPTMAELDSGVDLTDSLVDQRERISAAYHRDDRGPRLAAMFVDEGSRLPPYFAEDTPQRSGRASGSGSRSTGLRSSRPAPLPRHARPAGCGGGGCSGIRSGPTASGSSGSSSVQPVGRSALPCPGSGPPSPASGRRLWLPTVDFDQPWPERRRWRSSGHSCGWCAGATASIGRRSMLPVSVA